MALNITEVKHWFLLPSKISTQTLNFDKQKWLPQSKENKQTADVCDLRVHAINFLI